MGFFSSSDEISVFANTCHLAEANPNALQDAVLYAVFSGKPLVSCILNTTLNQMSTQVDNFRSYAKESYSLGLPQVTYEQSILFPEQDVIDAISADTNREYGVALNFHYVSPLIPVLAVAPYLFSARGWDSTTNIISVLPSEYQESTISYVHYEGKVYDVTLNEDYTLATITYEVTIYRMQYSGTIFSDDRELYRNVLATQYFNDIQPIPPGLNYGRDYCVASYHVLDSEGSPSDNLYWWYYDISSKKYPALIPSNSIDEQDNLLPVVPIRYKNQSMVREAVQETNLYKTSKTLLKKIGLDINAVASSLEENPNIDDIDNAYITFGVNLQSDEVSSIRYLAEFFDHISDKGQADFFSGIEEIATKSSLDTQELGLFSFNSYRVTTGTTVTELNATNEVSWTASDETSTTLSVTSNSSLGDFEEYGLNMEITYSYILSEIKEGSIGDIGYAEKSWVAGPHSSDKTNASAFGKYYAYDDSSLILKVQIAENAYKQITVKGLVHRNHVHSERTVVTTLYNVISDEDQLNFIIPIHYNLSTKLPPLIRSQLYQDSLFLVLNSVVITSAKWYEASFFKFLTFAVGLTLIAFSGGTSTFLTALSTAAAAGAGALMTFLLESIVFSFALSKTLDFVAEWVGPEIMALLSVAVMALAGFAKGAKLPGITLLGSTTPAASQLMFLATSMLSSASSSFTGLIEDVADEMESFEEEKTAKYKELEEYSELLDELNPDAINLLDAQTYSATLRQPMTNSPEEFYDLAIHTGNPGTLSLSIPMTFYDIALTLPKPDTQTWV